MQIPLQIMMRVDAPVEAIEARIREHAAKLERFNARITSCRVALEETHAHQASGRKFEVRIDLRAPGHTEIAATRHADEDVNVAIREAFAAATRQLEDAARAKRDDAQRPGKAR